MISRIRVNRKLIHQSIILLTVIVLAVGVIILSGSYFGRSSEFDYSGNLDKSAFAINGEVITLREFGYYVMDVEEYVNAEAVIYNPDDPLDYWDTHFAAGKNSSFIYALAKEQAYEACVSDYLYSKEAVANGYELSALTLSEVKTEAEDLYNSMTDKQLSNTGLTLEDIITLRTRAELATSYATNLAENVDWSYTVNSPVTELAYSGDYFQDNILDKYNISMGKLWKSIEFGKITIN